MKISFNKKNINNKSPEKQLKIKNKTKNFFEKMSFRLLKLSFLSCFVLLLILSPVDLRASNSAELKIAITQEWSGFNPVTENLASNSAMSHFVNRSLMILGGSGQKIPDLAVQIPSFKNKLARWEGSGTNRLLKVDWEIKKNAKWGDGQLITCEDLHLGWLVGRHENVSVSERSPYTAIKDITWKDSNKNLCTLVYNEAKESFDRNLPRLIPSHIEKKNFEKWSNQALAYEQNSEYQKNPLNPGLYNGPYIISEFKLGSHVTFIRNPHFFGKPAQIEKVIFKYLSDSGTLRAHLKSDSINAIAAVGFPPDLALGMSDEFSKDSQSAFKVHFQDSPIFQGIFLNTDSEKLKDIKIRKAISLSIDKQKIVDSFFSGKLLPAASIFSPMDPLFEKFKNQFSIKEARQLIESSGYKLGSDQFYEKDGKKIELTFRTSAGLKILESIQVLICNDFQRVGIKCNIKNQPPRVLLGNTIPQGDFDLAMFGQPILPNESVKSIYHSEDIPSSKNSFAGSNVTRTNTREIDQKINSYEKSWNENEKIKLMKSIGKLVLENYSLVPLYHRREAFVVPKKLQGFQADASGTGFQFPETWKL